ncbi:GH-E family nuclease [Collinsella stercoris]|uniref:GH-E family nuclease n=1 Tax=Collinsella stercoris TaxID=147206 RepID=UPI003CD0E264
MDQGVRGRHAAESRGRCRCGLAVATEASRGFSSARFEAAHTAYAAAQIVCKIVSRSFLKAYEFNPDNFQIETPSANRSHKYE